MKCPSCHSDIPNNSKFCRVCGNALPVQPKKQISTGFKNSSQSFTNLAGTSSQVEDRTSIFIQGALWVLFFLILLFPTFKVRLWGERSRYSLFRLIFDGSQNGGLRILAVIFLIMLIVNIATAIFLFLKPVSHPRDVAYFESHSLGYSILFLVFCFVERVTTQGLGIYGVLGLTWSAWIGIFICFINMFLSIAKLTQLVAKQ